MGVSEFYTKTQIKVKDLRLYWCSAIHSHSRLFKFSTLKWGWSAA